MTNNKETPEEHSKHKKDVQELWDEIEHKKTKKHLEDDEEREKEEE